MMTIILYQDSESDYGMDELKFRLM